MEKLALLRPKTRELCLLFIVKCKESGIDVAITQTLRTIEVQNAFFAQGREDLKNVNALRKIAGLSTISQSENKIITNARGGLSPHNYGLAFDFVPMKDGKEQWNDIELFKKCGEIGKNLRVEKYKLKWGGDFTSIKDFPHFEMDNWQYYK